MAEKRKAKGVSILGIMNILLTILGMLGLILLGLLALLLFILLLVLFMPFSYRLRVKYTAKQFEAEGEISFLFKFLRAKFTYGEELAYQVKAAFFSIFSSEKNGEKNGGEIEADAEIKQSSKGSSEAIVKVDEKTKNKAEAETAKETENEKNMKISSTKVEKKEEKVQPKSEEEINEEKQTDKRRAEKNNKNKKEKEKKKKLNIISKIKRVKDRFVTRWTAFKKTFSSLNNKKEAVLKFINAEGTKAGVLYLLTQCKILLKMVLPKKMKGWLRFGTGDVYTEGQYLSYLCFLYPLYAGKFEILPEWEEEVIEADISFSGRIIMFVGLLIALRLLFSRKVKSLRNNFNRCKKSFAKG